MVFVEKMKSMKIYKQPCFLPTAEGNKKKDSAIILLTPSYESSKKLMNHPMFINKKRFESYFLDRDVSYYIGNKKLEEVDEAFLYLEETKRSELKDSDFGIPEDRKFPLDTEEHVRSAIKLFGHAEEGKKKSLARRISRKASQYGIEIPETTQVYKYLHESISITDEIPEMKTHGPDDNLDFMFSVPETDIIDIKFEMDEKEKRWNSVVIVKGVAPKTLRGRSECLVIKDDEIYLDFSDDGICSKGTLSPVDYDVPGGGWDPGEDHIVAARRETEEEAKIKVRDIQYIDNYLNIDKERPEGCYCDGLFSKVYIGKYDGRFNGPIADVDRADIAVSGKFYPINLVYGILNPIHRKAIRTYFGTEFDKIVSPENFEHPVEEAYYRITYDDIGIYDALKQNMSKDEWKEFLSSDKAKWLPKPEVDYQDNYRSYFTNNGYNTYMNKTKSIMDEYLDKDKIKVDKISKPSGDIVYKDRYQIVISEAKQINESENASTLDKNFKKKTGYTSKYMFIEESILTESENASTLDKNFKKKTGYTFRYMSIKDAISGKYVEPEWNREGSEGIVAICNQNNKPAGFIYVNKSGKIGSLRVYDDYRGYGISNELMKQAIEYGGKELAVYSDNQVAINLYKKFGFKDTGKRKKYKDGSEVIFMKLDKESVNEAYMKNEKDVYYNKEAFDNGDINLCFITGHVGSGKSSLAHAFEKDNIEVYELDDVQFPQRFSDDNFKEYGDLIYSFFKGEGKKYRIPNSLKTDDEGLTDWMIDHGFTKEGSDDNNFCGAVTRAFVNYAIKYARSHKDKKFIIEGIQLFLFIEPSLLKDYAVYIKGTSVIISTIRSVKRDSYGPGPLHVIDNMSMFYLRIKDTLGVNGFESKIKKWRTFFNNQSIKEGTEFILET